VRGDSASAAIYESFMTTFLRRVAEPSLGTALLNEYVERWPRWSTFVGRVMEEKPTELLPTGERDYDTFMLTTFVESLKNLRLATKSDDPTHWIWKQLHQIDFREGLKHNLSTPFFLMSILFAPSTIGLGGDQDCVNNCDYQIDQIPWRYLSTSGPTIRSVIDMADDDKIYQTLTLGQSGHILSAHRNDQLRSWLNSEPHAIGFSEKQIERQLQHTLVLTNRSE
jgi:acyl-homoserine lactone acylase PvdQ